MSVETDALQKSFDDYEATTGRKTAQFVCPITLQAVPISDVIKGHILNEAFFKASRQTVLQWGKVDEFFGATVEPDLIRHLNLKDKNDKDLVSGADFYVEFGDMTIARAFPVGGKSARAAVNKFPKVLFATADGEMEFFVATSKTDHRLAGEIHLRRKEGFYPSFWVAAGLKAAFLMLWKTFGYKICFDPMGGVVRQSLATFFETKAVNGAEQHFKEFSNAFRIMGIYDEGKTYDPFTDYTPYAFDSITGHQFLHYQSQDGTVFALGVLFSINEMTVTIAVPFSLRPTEAGTVWPMYQNMMSENAIFKYTVRPVTLVKGVWKNSGNAMPPKLFETFPVLGRS